ncbi:cellulose binding domain-containing protein, partial [Micromonospora sp. NBS 11-29]|uniref:cellulose binding domain-containing protein n=1 Tax=Micromonospora sp. NBS 11-29 TaxID=1960879 RepID=UPI0020CF3434
MHHPRRRATLIAAATTLTLTTAGLTATQLPAAAATGCAVTYTVSSSWPGGFGANVTVTNLGDPLTSWRLTWTF